MIKKAAGFSLIEAIITVFILVIITLAFSDYIPTQKKITALSVEKTQQTELEQIVLILISKALHNAGYMGCKNTSQFFPAVVGYSASANNLPLALKGKAIKESDIILVNTFSIPWHQVTAEIGATSLTIPRSFIVEKDDEIVISDCVNSELIHSKSIQNNKIYFSNDEKLTHTYTNAIVAINESAYWYVGQTDRKDKKGIPINALYKQPLHGSRQEMIEAIEWIKFAYAIKDNFVDANHITDFNAVRRVKVTVKIKHKIVHTEVSIPNA